MLDLDKLTLHQDDYKCVGWFDTPQGDPPRGSVALIVVNKDAVQQRENADLLRRIAREKAYGH